MSESQRLDPPEDRFDRGGVVPVAVSPEGEPQIAHLANGDRPFGASLEPVLGEACQGRLSPVNWFRTDWQRSGAATGYATFRDDAGIEHPVVVKLPVPPQERQWLMRLQGFEHVAPRLYAHGDTLGGYDIAWVVMERLAQGPLSAAWGGAEFDLFVQTAGRFYAATATFPGHGQPRRKDWEAILKRSRQSVRSHGLAHEQRWTHALKKVHKKLPKWVEAWEGRDTSQWCHGDLHLGNAMTRAQPPDGPALLFDYAEVRPGHWLEDAVYLEHLYWARRHRLGERRLCRMIARQRKENGLPNEPDWPRLAGVMRALLAMSTPAMLHADGDPRHVEAALEVLEHEVAG